MSHELGVNLNQPYSKRVLGNRHCKVQASWEGTTTSKPLSGLLVQQFELELEQGEDSLGHLEVVQLSSPRRHSGPGRI